MICMSDAWEEVCGWSIDDEWSCDSAIATIVVKSSRVLSIVIHTTLPSTTWRCNDGWCACQMPITVGRNVMNRPIPCVEAQYCTVRRRSEALLPRDRWCQKFHKFAFTYSSIIESKRIPLNPSLLNMNHLSCSLLHLLIVNRTKYRCTEYCTPYRTVRERIFYSA